MAIVIIDDKYLTQIADAIRVNNGKDDTYTTSKMPAAIAGLTNYDSDSSNADADFLKRYLFYASTGDYARTQYTNSNLIEINKYLFEYCGGFSHLFFPNVTFIGDASFQYCDAAIYLPSLTSITSDEAFYYAYSVDCPGVTEIKADKVCYELSGRMNFPNLTTVEGTYVFGGKWKRLENSVYYFPSLQTATGHWFHEDSSDGLTTIILPSIQTVGPIEHSRNLYSKIVLPGSTIPVMDEYDDSTGAWGSLTSRNDSRYYIYVPASMVDAYKSSSWGSFYGSSYIRAIEDYPEVMEGYDYEYSND